MRVEIIPPGEQPGRDRSRDLRRRIMLWCAVIAGFALAIGIIAVGFIVLAVAAVIGVAAGILLAALRWLERRRGSGNDAGAAGFTATRGPGGIEIVSLRIGPHDAPSAGADAADRPRDGRGGTIDRPPDR
jgi:hypothetical protein